MSWSDPPERLPERDAAIAAMLAHVPFDGWTARALTLGVADAGLPADEAALLFPLGAADMVAAYCDLADRWMAADAESLAETRASARIRALILARLDRQAPHREAVRRAVAVLALPGNAGTAAGCLARTVDAIWRLAGDRTADASWYSKRAILAGVYSATLLFWLNDSSDGAAATRAFLDRRLAGVARFGALRGRIEALLPRALPRFPLPRTVANWMPRP